jgi:hypothetical protein
MTLAEHIEQLDRQIAEAVEARIAALRRDLGARLRRSSEELMGLLDEVQTPAPQPYLADGDLAPLAAAAAASARGEALAAVRAAVVGLDRATNQSGLLDALLDTARGFASRAALFLTRADGAEGWASNGFGDLGQAVEGLTVRYAEDPAWARFAQGRGPVRLSAVDCARLCSRLETELPREGLLVPLVLRDRIAAAVYADRLPDEGPLEIEPLQILTHLAALALETLAFRQRAATPTLADPDARAGTGLDLWDASVSGAPGAEPAAAAAPAAVAPAAAPVEPAPPEPIPVAAPPAVEEPVPVAEEPAPAAAPPAAAPELAEAEDYWMLEEETAAAAERPPAPWEASSERRVAAAEEIAVEPSRREPELYEPSPAPAAAPEEAPEEAEEEETRHLERPSGPDLPATPAAVSSSTQELALPATPSAPAQEEELDQTQPNLRRLTSTAPLAAATAPASPAPAAASSTETRAVWTPGASPEVRPPADLEGPGWAFATTRVPVAGGDESLHEEARRLARLLVSEIKLYNEEQVDEGRRSRDVYERLKDDIDRSRQMYEERVDERIRNQTDYFYQELVRILGGGDPKALGI